MDKYQWTDEVFDSVHWFLICSVCSHSTHTIKIQMSKILHGWLSIMHMLSHITNTSQCPSCSSPDATLDHPFRCPHPLLVSTHDEIIKALRKKGLKQHTPRIFIDLLRSLFTDHFGSNQLDTPSHPSFADAYTAQSLIWVDMFLRGHLASMWSAALVDIGVEHPSQTMLWLLRFFWFNCIDALW
jgi:hypothetical protein